jgi:hypothetical protein
MPSFLQIETDWNVYWTSYTGLVRVRNLLYTSVEYGEATGEILAEQYQAPGMEVSLDSGVTLWLHPQYVQPVDRRGS